LFYQVNIDKYTATVNLFW